MTTYHLSIHKPCGSFAGMDTFSSTEIQLNDEIDFLLAKSYCEERKNMAGFWKQTVLPIRTDRTSDLFFPTLIHLVMKTKNCATSCLAVLGALFWDLATLPIRLLTFLPRLIYNACVQPEEHPLIPYLRGKGLDAIHVEGSRPVTYRRGVIHYLEPEDGRANVILYKRGIIPREERAAEHYQLYLTDREIAFPTYEHGTSSNSLP